jgi:hypothetical protein
MLDVRTLLSVHRRLREHKKGSLIAIRNNIEYDQFMRDNAVTLVEIIFDSVLTEIEIMLDDTQKGVKNAASD